MTTAGSSTERNRAYAWNVGSSTTIASLNNGTGNSNSPGNEVASVVEDAAAAQRSLQVRGPPLALLTSSAAETPQQRAHGENATERKDFTEKQQQQRQQHGPQQQHCDVDVKADAAAAAAVATGCQSLLLLPRSHPRRLSDFGGSFVITDEEC